MILHGQAAIGGLELLIAAVAGDAEKFVVFDFGHVRASIGHVKTYLL
jgi:hypothetical protein